MRKHLTYANVMATLAVFIALGGTAYAVNTVGSPDVINESLLSQDIKNGEVKVADIGQQAVATDELANGQVKAADIGDGEVKTAEIASGQVLSADIGAGEVRSGNVANDNLTGADIAANTVKGADIDEATLDVGDAARAYARVSRLTCTGTPGTCTPEQSKGISSVTRDGTGAYCVTAPGIDPDVTPAAVTVDWGSTAYPLGNASAMTREDAGCGPEGKGFRVITERQPIILVDSGGGTNNASAAGTSAGADDVGFTIVIP